MLLNYGPLYADEPSYTVQTESTKFIGLITKEKNNNKNISFLGIPFAQPPVNELRSVSYTHLTLPTRRFV